MAIKVLLFLVLINNIFYSQSFNSIEQNKKSWIKSLTVYNNEEFILKKVINTFRDKNSRRAFYFKYDKYGNEKEMIMFDAAGKPYIKTKNTYDNKENVIKTTFSFEKIKKFSTSSQMQYDKKGKIIKTIQYNNEGKLNQVTEYKYSCDKLTEAITTYDYRDIIDKYIYKYDDEGRVVELYMKQSNGEIKSKIFYRYLSNLDEEMIIHYDNGKEQHKEINHYNKTKKKIAEFAYEGGSNEPIKCKYYSYLYNNDGSIHQCYVKDKDGEILNIMDYVYDYYK